MHAANIPTHGRVSNKIIWHYGGRPHKHHEQRRVFVTQSSHLQTLVRSAAELSANVGDALFFALLAPTKRRMGNSNKRREAQQSFLFSAFSFMFFINETRSTFFWVPFLFAAFVVTRLNKIDTCYLYLVQKSMWASCQSFLSKTIILHCEKMKTA